jgi:hypothetical protein
MNVLNRRWLDARATAKVNDAHRCTNADRCRGCRPLAGLRPKTGSRSLLAGYQMKPIEARELVAGIASLLHLRR